jgi:hypothetical protein
VLLCVFFEVGTEFLSIVHMRFGLQMVKKKTTAIKKSLARIRKT